MIAKIPLHSQVGDRLQERGMRAVSRPRLVHSAKAISSFRHQRSYAPFEPMALLVDALRRAPGLASVTLLLAASAG